MPRILNASQLAHVTYYDTLLRNVGTTDASNGTTLFSNGANGRRDIPNMKKVGMQLAQQWEQLNGAVQQLGKKVQAAEQEQQPQVNGEQAKLQAKLQDILDKEEEQGHSFHEADYSEMTAKEAMIVIFEKATEAERNKLLDVLNSFEQVEAKQQATEQFLSLL